MKSKEQVLDCDFVVLAIGTQSNNELYQLASQQQTAPQIFQIGDAFEYGRVFEATKAGFAVGRTI